MSAIERLEELGRHILLVIEGNPLNREIALESLESVHKLIAKPDQKQHEPPPIAETQANYQIHAHIDNAYGIGDRQYAPELGAAQVCPYPVQQRQEGICHAPRSWVSSGTVTSIVDFVPVL